jgi:hypothetical protein
MMFSMRAIFTDNEAKLYHQVTGNKKLPVFLTERIAAE